MTAALRTVAGTLLPGGRSGPEPLEQSLSPQFLDLIGWDWSRRTVVFPAEHPQLGWTPCRVRGCGKPTASQIPLCANCANYYRAAGRPDFDTYIATTYRERRTWGVRPCRVAGCERPWLTEPGALCRSHLRQRRHLGLELEAFLVDARVTPLARWGQCQVGACPRDRATSGPYCGPHRERLRKHRRLDPGLDEQRWRRTEPAVSEDNAVCLLGLADQVVTELLYGLQHRTENGTKTSFRIFRGLAVRLLRLGAIRTSDLPDVGLDTATRAVRNLVVTAVADRDCDPLTCWDSDRWSLNSVGHAGAVRFDRITQNWLREAAKHWVFAELPKARSRTAATRMQTHVNAIVRLSASLVRHRDDHGRDLHRLGRHDVVEFLNWMGHLQATGRITRTTRHRECTHIAFVLRRMRSGGLTRPAGPLHGLADDFALEPDDMPAHHRDPASRDLPPEVVTALIDTLPALEAATSTEFRVAVELLMDTGRRPGEIVALRLECLDHDTDDKPVLLWDNYKTGRYGRRLPIPEATATIIATQQARVRARFPRTPASELVLLPSPLKNHDGRRPITIYYLRDNHRRWVTSGGVVYEIDSA